jgi:hypothetical protein
MLVVSFDTIGQRIEAGIEPPEVGAEPVEPPRYVTTSDLAFFDAETGAFIAANQTGAPER